MDERAVRGWWAWVRVECDALGVEVVQGVNQLPHLSLPHAHVLVFHGC